MIAEPNDVLDYLRTSGMSHEHPFVLGSTMLRRFHGDWEKADAECRRQARRFLDLGDENAASIMSLAARLCLFYGQGA